MLPFRAAGLDLVGFFTKTGLMQTRLLVGDAQLGHPKVAASQVHPDGTHFFAANT
jgi:hypothetical protein